MELPDALDLGRRRGCARVREDDWRLDHALSRVPDVPRWTYYPADVERARGARAGGAQPGELRRTGRGGRFVVERDGAWRSARSGSCTRIDGPYLYYAFLPEGRGLGLATVAVLALVALGVRARCGPQVHALTMLENTASERVLERASFVRGRPRGGARRPHGDRWSRARGPQPTHK